MGGQLGHWHRTNVFALENQTASLQASAGRRRPLALGHRQARSEGPRVAEEVSGQGGSGPSIEESPEEKVGETGHEAAESKTRATLGIGQDR